MDKMKMDIISPIYWIEKDLFKVNLKTWLSEIPYNKIYLGVNNERVMDYVNEISRCPAGRSLLSYAESSDNHICHNVSKH